MEKYWEKAEPAPVNKTVTGKKSKLQEINNEILDPLAKKVLEANPKAYIKRIKK